METNFLASQAMPSGKQIRAARVLLDWSAAELASKSQVGLATPKRIEADQSSLRATKQQILNTLENVGIKFLNENGIILNPTNEK